jgi:uncharacterized protein YdaU (DUF1376 family)
MSLNHFPFYPADYKRDTQRLSLEEHGAYLLLIMEYYMAGPLPDDDAKLARILHCDIRTWRRLRPEVSRKFAKSPHRLNDGCLHHKRIDLELEKTRRFIELGREGGIKSTIVRQAKSQAESQAKSQPNGQAESQAKSQAPLPEPESNLNLSTRMPRASPRPRERRASAQLKVKKARGPPRKGNGDAAVPALDEAKLAAYRDKPGQISAAALQIFGARVPRET